MPLPNFKTSAIFLSLFSFLASGGFSPLIAAKSKKVSHRFFGFIPFSLEGSYYSDNFPNQKFIPKININILARLGLVLSWRHASFTSSFEYISLNQFNLRELFLSYSFNNVILEVGKRQVELLGVGHFYHLSSVTEDIFFLSEDRQDFLPTFWGLNLGFVKGPHQLNWINHVDDSFETGERPTFVSSALSYSLENQLGFSVVNVSYLYSFENENQILSFSLENSLDTTVPGWLIYLGIRGRVIFDQQNEILPEGLVGMSYQPQQNIGLVIEYFYRQSASYLGLSVNVSLLDYRFYIISQATLNLDTLELVLPTIIGYHYNEYLANEFRVNYIRSQAGIDLFDIVNVEFRTIMRF